MLCLAGLLRAAAAWHWRDELHTDRDGYRGIARRLIAGDGYSSAAGEPTAYRPPLYPLLLAGLLWGGDAAIAVAQVLLGVGTVWGTYRLGRRLVPERAALAAAGLVAVDPLLLRYTPQLMTETLFAFLCTFLLDRITSHPPVSGRRTEGGGQRTEDGGQRAEDGRRIGNPQSPIPNQNPSPRHRVIPSANRTIRNAAVTGALFGLCALCRPTIWAWGIPVASVGLCWILRNRGRADGVRRAWGTAVVAALLVVSPWVVRNAVVFGRPIVMTTHGGYTLLLGNNPVFYREVVDQPWGTVWAGESRERWQQSLDRAMRDAEPPPETEIERDRFLFRRAVDNIRSRPATFAASCGLRVRRLWNVVPLSAAGGDLPAAVRWSVGGFYALLFLAALCGLLRLRKPEWRRWWPLVLLVLSFTAVHALYWSNARMRSPLVPAIALLAVRGAVSRRTEKAGRP